jgi:catechol 2,3-dioxygenase
VNYGIAPPGYRLPAATRLGPVRLQVADISRSLEYYQRVIGLRVQAREGGGAALGADGEQHPLVWLYERPGVRAVPRSGLLGLYHFAILLPERAALGRFIGHLGRLGEYAGSADHAVSEALYLTDPDGLGIEVYADRPRSEWRYEGHQLYMTTEPLNIRSLLAAGADRSWDGMPPRTTMGHVHLHVGDIEQAAAFYHRALGFDKVVWSYPGALFLSAGGYHHHLGNNTWSSGLPASADDARLLQWTIVLPSPADVAAAAASLEEAGYTIQRPDGSIVAADPWGTSVRIEPE